MGLRDRNKARNRQLILDAACKIIREEGGEHLTMRHLAQVAEVSVRTPSNLFKSKHGIFAALRDNIIMDIATHLAQSPSPTGIAVYIDTLDKVIDLFGKDEDYYRTVFVGLGEPNNAEDLQLSLVLARSIAIPVFETAQTNKELRADARFTIISDQIICQLIGFTNLWAFGQLNLQEYHLRAKLMMCTTFLSHTTRNTSLALNARIDALEIALAELSR